MAAGAGGREQALLPSDNDDEEASSSLFSWKAPPRRWLYDRIKGTSKIGKGRPPCLACWVPAPVGRCPSVFEENLLCRTWGRVGWISVDDEKARRKILRVGFFANLLGCLLTMYACLAVSDRADALHLASFSKGTVSGTTGVVATSVSIHLGLKAAVVEYAWDDTPDVVPFAEFCDLPPERLGRYIQADEDCGACEEVSQTMVRSVILSAIAFLPSFTTDILRSYSNYDVNCQKGFATLFATCALILSLTALLQYNNRCFAGFYAGEVSLDYQGNPIGDDDDNAAENTLVTLDFSWDAGPGLLSLYIGTSLKAFDIAANLLVPTPEITRNRRLQWEYERRSDETMIEEDLSDLEASLEEREKVESIDRNTEEDAGVEITSEDRRSEGHAPGTSGPTNMMASHGEGVDMERARSNGPLFPPPMLRPNHDLDEEVSSSDAAACPK